MAHRGAVIITLLVCIALVDAAGVSLWSPPLQCDSSLIDGCNTLGAIPCMGKRVSANYPVVAACDAQQSSAQTSKMGAITVFSMNATLPRRTFQPGETFKLSVSLRDKPTYRVALNISSRVPANVNVGTTTLVFTPENYGIAQGIDVTITAGAAVRPYFRFSLNQTRPVTCEALCLRVNGMFGFVELAVRAPLVETSDHLLVNADVEPSFLSCVSSILLFERCSSSVECSTIESTCTIERCRIQQSPALKRGAFEQSSPAIERGAIQQSPA
eukprot:Opistho-2@56159